MSVVQLDLGARGAVVREGSADPLALSLAVASRFGEVMGVLAYPGFEARHEQVSPAVEMNAQQALDLRVLAGVQDWSSTLAHTLGRAVEWTPRLKRRVTRLRAAMGRMREPICAAFAPSLDAVAGKYQAWLAAQGWQLYGYQLKDAARLAAKGRGLLSYQMRLGKTRVAGAAALARGCRRILVLADSGPLNVWKSELEEVFGISGDQAQMLAYGKDLGGGLEKAGRAELAGRVREASAKWRSAGAGRPVFLLVSFGLLAQGKRQRRSGYWEYPLAKALMRFWNPGSVIVDEAHHAANRETRHAHIMGLFHAPLMVACTGTPTRGDETTQTTLPAWLSRGPGRVAYPWRRHVRLEPVYERSGGYARRRGKGSVNALREIYASGPDLGHLGLGYSGVWDRFTGESAHRIWNSRMAPLLIVREEADSAVRRAYRTPDPELQQVLVPFDPLHESYYRKVLEELRHLKAHLEKVEAEERRRLAGEGHSGAKLEEEVAKVTGKLRALSARKFFNTLQKLSMVSTCPWDGRVVVAGTLERYLETPTKYRKVLELAREAVGEGRKAVLLTHFDAYTRRLAYDLRHEGLVSLTGGLDAKAKAAAVQRFTHDPGSRLLLLNSAAGGEAFDLSAASRMIVADLDDRMTKFTQSLRRLCGPRQKETPVIQLVLHTLSCGRSVDEDLYGNLTRRKALADLARNDLAVPPAEDWRTRAERLLR